MASAHRCGGHRGCRAARGRGGAAGTTGVRAEARADRVARQAGARASARRDGQGVGRARGACRRPGRQLRAERGPDRPAGVAARDRRIRRTARGRPPQPGRQDAPAGVGAGRSRCRRLDPAPGAQRRLALRRGEFGARPDDGTRRLGLLRRPGQRGAARRREVRHGLGPPPGPPEQGPQYAAVPGRARPHPRAALRPAGAGLLRRQRPDAARHRHRREPRAVGGRPRGEQHR